MEHTQLELMLEALEKEPSDISPVASIARDFGWAAPTMTSQQLASESGLLTEAMERFSQNANPLVWGALMALTEFTDAYMHKRELIVEHRANQLDISRNPFRYHVMLQIADGAQRNSEIAKRLERSQQQVNTARRQLQDGGLIEPFVLPGADLKASHYRLTKKGEALVARLREYEAPIIPELVADAAKSLEHTQAKVREAAMQLRNKELMRELKNTQKALRGTELELAEKH